MTSPDITIIIHPKTWTHLPFNSPVEQMIWGQRQFQKLPNHSVPILHPTSRYTYSPSKPLRTKQPTQPIKQNSIFRSVSILVWAPAGGGTHIVLNPIRQLMSGREGVQNLCLSREALYFKKRKRPPKVGPKITNSLQGVP